MCVANSARSQLAEGLAIQTFPEAEIQSAGSHPGKLNPYAVKVMNEIGIDISRHHSKSIDDLSPKFIVGLDYVITLCAEEVCPTMVSKFSERHLRLRLSFILSIMDYAFMGPANVQCDNNKKKK